MSKLDKYLNDSSVRVTTGACPHDCPDTCSWQVAVEQESGRAIDIWGHEGQPVTQGRLCGKVDRYLERTYHRERLVTPLRRVGAKGSSAFVAVSWEEAITAIAARLKATIAAHGAEAVLPYSYAGTMGLLQGEGMAMRFFNRMGASDLARTICSEAGFEGYQYTMGRAIGMETQDYAHAQLILIWGSNTLTSNQHLWPFVQEARKNGARVVVIDPARTRTARAADEWLPIRPGSDGALALAMMQVIISEGLHDAEYVERYTEGFEALAERVQGYTPEWAAPLTGISAERIRALAREYATTRPAAIRVNYGMQRHAGGGMAMRNVTCLPALVGAWRAQGGGIQLSSSGSFPFDRTMLYHPELLAGRKPRTFNMNRLGDALTHDAARLAQAHHHPRPVDPIPAPEEAGPPVHALIVYNCNPAAVAPDQGAVVTGLRREDLFTVVLEQFQTDTADYADYVLPATTQLEHWDLLKPYGHLFVALNRPAIAPLGQSLPNSEIFRRLATAMGYEEPCFQQSDVELLEEFVRGQQNPVFATVTWETLLEQGFARLNLPQPFLPFAEGNFPTPSGRCEFYSTRLAEDGYDPLPAWVPPSADAGDSDSWLQCISPPAHSFLNSTFVNVDRLQAREKHPMLWVHPRDAAARNLAEGEIVRVWNELGEVELPCHITEEIIAGTVLAPGVWWAKFSPDGRNINQVTPQDEADMGAGALFYDVLVRVEKRESVGAEERRSVGAGEQKRIAIG
ncbi:MAG: molybdopterin oxidoreductase family protein [Ardenticatenales bacterium]|nr:molybdopterin oxidoreductase family protein [Ardenticatenales bacterium]